MAYLKYISYFLPENKLNNNDLCEDTNDFTPEKILHKVGISNRYRVNSNQFSSDLGCSAAEKLFKEYKVNKVDIDFILFCTQSPDYPLPTTACIIQDKLGLNKNCGALDYNLGCSGFTYGLMIAKSLVDSGIANNILLITSETYSLHLEKNDISNNSIFSDAASASLITNCSNNNILDFIYGTDGSGAKNLISQKNSFKNSSSNNSFFMNGAEVFKFALFEVPALVRKIIEKNGLNFEDIDLFIFHQASKVVLNAIKRKLKIPEDKFFNNIIDIGNTVSSTIPIALKDAISKKKIKKGQLVLIAGFGVGYSWAGTIIRF